MEAPKRSWPRRLGLLLGGLLALGLVLFLGLVLVLRAVVDPASLADRAEPHLSAALNRQVSIRSADLKILPFPEVRLHTLRVENLPDFEGLPLATVDELQLRPRLLPLLKRRVEIDRVRVVGPRVLLQIDSDGKTNFGDFVPASREEEDAARTPMSLQIDGIDVVEGRIGFRDAVSGRSVQADGVRIEGSVHRDAAGRLGLDLESGLDSLRFSLPPVWPRSVRGLRVELDLEAVAGPRMGWIEIAAGTATVNGLTVDLSGRADSLKEPRRLVDLAIRGENVDLSRIVTAMPDSLRSAMPFEVWGDLGVDVRLSGAVGPEEWPDVEGMMTIRGGGVRKVEGPAGLEDLDADLTIADGAVEVSTLRARLPGGQMAARGSFALDSTLRFEATADGRADVGELFEAFLAGGADRATPSRGTLGWNVAASGSLDRLDAARLSGQLGLEGLEIEGGPLARSVEVPEAVIRLEGTAARWASTPVFAAGDPIEIEGALSDVLGRLAAEPRTPSLRATARGARLDLDALLGESEEEIGYGRIAWARLADRSVEGRSPEEWAEERDLSRPGTLPVSGRIGFRLDSVLRLPYRLSAVEGQLLLRPDRVELVETRFAAYGGIGSASGFLDLGEVEAEPFRLDLALEGIRAERYLAQNTPLGTLVSGSLTMDLSLEGGLDSLVLPVTQLLTGSGRFEIRNGRIASNPLTEGLVRFLKLGNVQDLQFDRWTSPFAIEDGRIILDASSFAGTQLVADITGAVGFGGGLDLGALIRPDSVLTRTAVSAAGAAGEVIDRYLGAGGAVELAVRLTGQAANPNFALDPTAMRESSQDVIDQAARRARQTGEAEVRRLGAEAVRGLLGNPSRTPADTGSVATDTTGGSATDTTGTDGR